MTSSAKQRLREQLLAARRARTTEQIEQARTAIRAAVLRQCAQANWRSLACYVPLRTEPGSTALLDMLTARGARVVVPVLRRDHDLDWALWTAEQEPSTVDAMTPPGERLGVDAIRDVDAVLVPALAVAGDGTRLGRGGGSYDRALRRVRPGTAITALLYDEELVDSLPSEPWDVAVTAVVTPAGWARLPGAGGWTECACTSER